MIYKQRWFAVITLALSIVQVRPALAQSNNSNNNLVPEVLFVPPPDDRKPQDTSGAGSRQNWQCDRDVSKSLESNKISLTALVPPSNYGLTSAEHPTLWFYLPETSARQIILSVTEEGDKPFYQTSLSITGQSSIVGIPIPRSSPSLEIGKNYQWAVVLVCGDEPDPNDPAIAAWVLRIAPPSSISPQLQQKTVLEQALVYGKEGLWYDSLTALIEARQLETNKDRFADIWHNFFESAGLGKIPSETPLTFHP